MNIVIPPQIQVGGHIYRIVFNEDLKDDNDYGRVNHRLLQIELNPARPLSQKIESLIHELLHVINNVYYNGHLDEDCIGAMSEGLLQVVRQLGIDPDFTRIQEIPPTGGKE